VFYSCYDTQVKNATLREEITDFPHSGANRAASVKRIGAAFLCPILFRRSLPRAHAANQADKRSAQCFDNQHKAGAHKPRRQTDSLLDRPNGKAYEQTRDDAKQQKVNEYNPTAMYTRYTGQRGGRNKLSRVRDLTSHRPRCQSCHS